MEQQPDAPIPDKPTGQVSTDRLQALADRVGPSFDAHRLKRWSVWLLVFLITLGGAMACFLIVLQAVIHAKKELVVPDLRGKNVTQALDIIADLELSLSKDSVEVNESVPAGSILKQVPEPGLTVREGKVIRITLSSGGQSIFVPELVSKNLPEAQTMIRSSGLDIGSVSESYSQKYEAGIVMGQDPLANAVAPRGQMVDLIVSKGVPPEGTVLMPDFVNQPVNSALEWAKAQNIQPRVSEELNSQVLPGLVVSQSPVADATITPQSDVKFSVSKSTAASAGNVQVIRYRVPAGTGQVQLRIVVRDERGEREVLQASKAAGTDVQVPVSIVGPARARIFVNGVLIEERPME